eukprot:TRINITY_DN208_c0_g1_i2.p1 TRINITY_DN208_c0_g1~~TRINITY_DN208_c0_g1_i2.p1  ORF type:complete len:249 (-),score=57.59 TRINITY_DN208_c0_g1_i2:214-960(-)
MDRTKDLDFDFLDSSNANNSTNENKNEDYSSVEECEEEEYYSYDEEGEEEENLSYYESEEEEKNEICNSGEEEEEEEGDICRICRLSEGTLISPCLCDGTIKYIHKDCLISWIKYRINSSSFEKSKHCELCNTPYNIKNKKRPFLKWKAPILTTRERTRLHFFFFSYLLAAIDIGYSIRWFIIPCYYNKLSKQKMLFKCVLLLFTSISWIYIFIQHKKFYTIIYKKWSEQNTYISLELPSNQKIEQQE